MFFTETHTDPSHLEDKTPTSPPTRMYGAAGSNVPANQHVNPFSAGMFGPDSHKFAQGLTGKYLIKTIQSNEVLVAERDEETLNRIRKRDPVRSIVDEPHNNLNGDNRDWKNTSVKTYSPTYESSRKQVLSQVQSLPERILRSGLCSKTAQSQTRSSESSSRLLTTGPDQAINSQTQSSLRI